MALGILIAASAAAVLGLLWIERRNSHVKPGDVPACGACGYCVKGLAGRTCPECGADLLEAGIAVEELWPSDKMIRGLFRLARFRASHPPPRWKADAEHGSQTPEFVAKLRRRFPRAYERWTCEEDERLAAAYKSGGTVKQLAEGHKRRPSAIRSRLRKLGLLPTL